MSYRNPKQIIDTQSGQHVRDMQKSLADTFSKYSSSINTIMEEQAEEEAKASELARARSNKYANKVSGDINQLATKNKAIDFSAFTPWLSVTSDIMKKQPHTWDQTDRNIVNNINTLGTDAANNLANTIASGETYVEARDLPLFTEGAIYSGFTNSEKEMTPKERAKYIDNSYKKLDIFYGVDGVPGSKSYEIDPTGLGTKFKTIIYDENGVEIGSSRNSTMDSLDIPVIIPRERKNMQQLVKQTAASMNLGSITSIAYKDQESIEVPLSKDPSNTKYQSSKRPSRALFLELAYEEALANIKALPADEAIAYNNDILKKYNNPIKMRKKWVGGTEEQIASDKKDLETIAKAYAQYAADTPEGREVLSTSKDFGITTRELPEKNDDAPSKPTAQQIATQDLIKNTTESIKALDVTKLKSSEQIADAVREMGFEARGKKGTIGIYKNNIFKGEIPAGSTPTKALESLAVASGLSLGQATIAVKNSKTELQKYAEEWDKNNPGPISDAFRTLEIMKAYEKSKNK